MEFNEEPSKQSVNVRVTPQTAGCAMIQVSRCFCFDCCFQDKMFEKLSARLTLPLCPFVSLCVNMSELKLCWSTKTLSSESIPYLDKNRSQYLGTTAIV